MAWIRTWLIIINLLWFKWKIHLATIVDNGVTYLFAKFGDDWLWDEKALVLITTKNQQQEQRS